MKKSRTGIKSIILINSLFMFVFASCRLEVPVKEMSKARFNITRAVEVKAEKYAPEEFKKAEEELIKAHDKVRIEDVKEAKKAAEESKKYSDKAIEKSLPLLADDTLKEARSLYEDARSAYAENYAPDEFALAGEKIQESEMFFQDNEYWESYKKSLEAIGHASAARDNSLANAEALRERINKIEEEANDLKSYGADDYAPDEMRSIETNLADAGKLTDGNNLKEASEKVSDAEDSLKEATSKTWKGYASAKLKAAEDAVAALEKSPSRDAMAGDISRANALLAEGRTLLDNEAYRESVSKSEEVLDVVNSIKITEEKEIIEEEQERIAEISKEESRIMEYIVKYNPEKRDCLWRIAEYMYKDARLWPLIYMANKDQIKDPDLIFPGQKFKVPPVGRKDAPGQTKEETKKEDKPEVIIPENNRPESSGEESSEGSVENKEEDTGSISEENSGTGEKPQVIEDNGGAGDESEEADEIRDADTGEDEPAE